MLAKKWSSIHSVKILIHRRFDVCEESGAQTVQKKPLSVHKIHDSTDVAPATIRLDNPEAWSNVRVNNLGPIFSKAEEEEEVHQ